MRVILKITFENWKPEFKCSHMFHNKTFLIEGRHHYILSQGGTTSIISLPKLQGLDKKKVEIRLIWFKIKIL